MEFHILNSKVRSFFKRSYSYSYAILSSIKIMIIFNITSAEIKTITVKSRVEARLG